MQAARLARSVPTFGVPLFGIAVSVAILGLHAALLGEAHWRGDDFICAAFARDFGLRYLWQTRIDGWSPRPLSEPLFFLYGKLAAGFGRPFTVPFLALLWGSLFATTLVTMRRGHERLVRILIGLSVSCLFLLGHPVAELFFWPAGAVAYLTTLAACSLILFLLVDGRAASRTGAIALSASLAACAASSESGAIAAVPLALALAATLPGRRRPMILLIPTLLVAGFVFWTLARHRMVSTEAIGRFSTMHHLTVSLRPVPRRLLADLVSLWPAKLCLAAGLRWSSARLAPQHRALAAFAAALVLASGASIAAGFFQFGAPCCERHDSLRQCWMVLAIAAATLASTGWPPRPGTRPLGPAMLTLACLIGVTPRLAAIASDIRLMPAIVATKAADWQAGRDPNTSAMVFRLPPPSRLAGGLFLPPGQYHQPANDSFTAHGIMGFFGKRRLTVPPP